MQWTNTMFVIIENEDKSTSQVIIVIIHEQIMFIQSIVSSI